MRAALREDWISLLKTHLIADLRRKRKRGQCLLGFQGLVAIIRTKTNSLAGDEYHLQDPERLGVIRRSPWKEFRPRWDSITRIEFRYLSPPSPEVRALLTGKKPLRLRR